MEKVDGRTEARTKHLNTFTGLIHALEGHNIQHIEIVGIIP